MTRRNRGLVRYIWFCLELDEYDCALCAPGDPDLTILTEAENTMIMTGFESLFSTLSAWEPCGSLVVDVSLYSPSDSEHWFKYLTFLPDIPLDECESGWFGKQLTPVEIDDRRHGWTAGEFAPTRGALYRVFAEVLGEGPFPTDPQEYQWWQQLPLVPAITRMLLRQQIRRRWKPKALAKIFSRLPNLQEIHYEPWREWNDTIQRWTDEAYSSLLESLTSNQLRRLTLFENFNQLYPHSFYDPIRCELIRTPAVGASRALAHASLQLEHLAASYMVDASDFFDARKPSWIWVNLESLALASRSLAPDASPVEIDTLLQKSAAAALKMPNLRTMEIWNGREELAMLFRYQRPEQGRPARVTLRGTWELVLRPPAIKAWESVALRRYGHGLVLFEELLGPDTTIESHADSVHHLGLSTTVIRPVSLQQIRVERRLQKNPTQIAQYEH